MLRRLFAILGVAALAAGAPGCGPPPKDPAVAAFEGLFLALARGDAAQVHALLGPASRAELSTALGLTGEPGSEAVAERLAVRPGWTFIVDRSRRARLDEARSTADRRVVLGPIAGDTFAVPVVRVDGEWRVELLEARPTPGAGG